jgi:hypothetical protein
MLAQELFAAPAIRTPMRAKQTYVLSPHGKTLRFHSVGSFHYYTRFGFPPTQTGVPKKGGTSKIFREEPRAPKWGFFERNSPFAH